MPIFLSFHSQINLRGVNWRELTMAKKSCGKRPCSICRKWFQPDVRQKDRQQTCGRSSCQTELHRRNCHDYNQRNKEESANNYLEKKLERVKQQTVKENNKEPPPPIQFTRRFPKSPCCCLLLLFYLLRLSSKNMA